MIGTSVMKEVTTLNNKFYRIRKGERIISNNISIFMGVVSQKMVGKDTFAK